MRLYLLPVSTKRSLLYAYRLNTTVTNASLHDRLVQRAATMWSSWEAKDGGWQKWAVVYGNKLLRHIPIEEWSLKSIPALSPALKNLNMAKEKKGLEPVEVVYPPVAIAKSEVPEVLKKLATEREALHRSKLFWCCVGMPIAAPFAIVPVIPNFPLFYLMYRAWSHWKAIAGGKHVQFLLNNNLLSYCELPQLNAAYEPTTVQKVAGNASPERLLLKKTGPEVVSQTLEIPEVTSELDRAVFQVKNSIEQAAAKVNSTINQVMIEDSKEVADEKEPIVMTSQEVTEDDARETEGFIHCKKYRKEDRDSYGKKEKLWKDEKSDKYEKKTYKEKYTKDKKYHHKREKFEKKKLYISF